MLYLSFLLLVQLNELSKIIMSEINKASNQNPYLEYHISSTDLLFYMDLSIC